MFLVGSATIPSSFVQSLSINIIYINIIVYQKYTGTSIKYEKRLLRRCMHHFKSDSINNMDHMHNSGTISSDPKPNKVVQELKVMPQLKKAVLRAVCMRVQVQRLKESRLTIRGGGDQDSVVSEEI